MEKVPEDRYGCDIDAVQNRRSNDGQNIDRYRATVKLARRLRRKLVIRPEFVAGDLSEPRYECRANARLRAICPKQGLSPSEV